MVAVHARAPISKVTLMLEKRSFIKSPEQVTADDLRDKKDREDAMVWLDQLYPTLGYERLPDVQSLDLSPEQVKALRYTKGVLQGHSKFSPIREEEWRFLKAADVKAVIAVNARGDFRADIFASLWKDSSGGNHDFSKDELEGVLKSAVECDERGLLRK